jgi:hypothetical protein
VHGRHGRPHQDRHASWEADSVDVAAHEAGTLERAIAEEEGLVLAEAIEALPDDTREVLTLFYREGQSIRHVAEFLGLSEDAVKKRLERARATLKAEVIARFEDVARRTAPTAALTASVIAAITFAVPSTAAAATAAGATLLKGSVGVAAGAIFGTLFGTIGGVTGIFLGMRKPIATAIDEEERAALKRYRGRWVLGTLAFTTCIGVLAWTSEHGLLGRYALAAITLAASITFMVGAGYASQKTLPGILARRHELERERDPEGALRRQGREKRLRRLGFYAGMTCAAAGTLIGLYFSLRR